MQRRRLDRNILVISDLHLGEDLRPITTDVSYLRRIATLERELEAFLRHHTYARLDGLPWRLVVNGDMVDFMAVMILPGENAEATNLHGDDERQFGLALGEHQTVRKLDRVIERHQGVFQQLAAFVAAGNELVVVVGNHDVEFHYPAVQRSFVEHLRTFATIPDGRIRFCPWFYYEEELVYVEHGHQYDEYCSFDYQLHPVESGDHVAMSIAHAGIRYFANQVPQLQVSVGEKWGLGDWLRWGWAQGVGGFAQIFYIYGVMVWKIIEMWSRLTERQFDASRRERHQARLKALAGDFQIAVDKVEALDGLRSLPVPRRLMKILRAFFVDRLAVGFVVIVSMILTLILASGWHKLEGAAGLLTGAVLLDILLSRGRMVACEDALRRAPELIGRILRAPFIVFGHSHHAEAVKLASGSTYFNTGAWAAETIESAFTHLVISGDEPRAELRQWRDGASTPYPTEASGPVASPASIKSL